MTHSSPFTPDVPPVQVKSLLSTSAQTFRSQLKLSVTNRATSALLCSPNTTSCLVAMEITTILPSAQTYNPAFTFEDNLALSTSQKYSLVYSG